MRILFITTLLAFFSIFSYGQNQLPKLQISNLDGKTQDVHDFLKADISVISFWATWCIPCINELEAIQDSYEEWTDAGIEVIAISTDNQKTVSKVRPLVYGKNWEFEVLFDTNQDLKRMLLINAIPHIIVVKDGEIVYQRTGYNPGEEEELFQIVLDLKE